MSRYTVFASKGKETTLHYNTNNYQVAMEFEHTAKQLGYDEVYICDNLQEIMVG